MFVFWLSHFLFFTNLLKCLGSITIQTTQMSSEIKMKITSWNCRGLGKLKKVKEVMKRIKRMQSNIVFLQETALMFNDGLKVGRRWKGKVFSASFNSVTTMVHDSIPFHVNKVIKDKLGRYLIMQGNLLKEQVILVNICTKYW